MGFLSFASAINFRTFVDSLERSQLPWKAKFEVVLSGSILSFPFLLFPRESEESVNESKVENETETTFETPEGSSKEDKGTEMADTDKESGIDTEREKRISGQFLSGPRDPDLSVPVAAEVCQPCNSGESAPQNGEDTMLPVPKISQSSADDKASTSTSEAADTALSEEPTVRAEGGDIEMEESERNNDVTLQPHSLSPATANIISQTKIASGSPDITFQDLKRQARKFNIDLAPKLLFARGPLVEILISANISHYADFRTADRILTYRNGEIIQVPCSRADVFSSTFVSVIEKRLLMKFLTFCGNFEEHLEEYSGFEGKPFIEFLKSKRLTTNLQHFVIHAIAMVKENTDTVTGIRETQRFLRSLGRYSNSPFIWTIYGTGELPQAFCRMSAVFGGVYCLRNATKSIILSKETDKVQAIICSDSQRISAKYLIMGKNYLPSKYSVNANEHVSRAVLITNRSVKESEEDSVTLLTVPPMEGYEEPVRVIEIGPASMACPRGLFVVYLTTRGVGTAQNDLQPYVQQLFNTESNNGKHCLVIFAFYMNVTLYLYLSVIASSLKILAACSIEDNELASYP